MALHNLNYLGDLVSQRRRVNQGREPRSAHPSLTPCQLYRTRDGWIFLMCNKEKFWPVLCEAIGKPEWSARAAYDDFKARLANRGEAHRGARRGAVGAHDGGVDRGLCRRACRRRRSTT